MANFRIDQLQALDPSNYDPDNDLLIVQKPNNGGTFKISGGNVFQQQDIPSIQFLDAPIEIGNASTLTNGFSYPNQGNNTINMPGSIPNQARVAILIASLTGGSNTNSYAYYGKISYFNNSSFSSPNVVLEIDTSEIGRKVKIQQFFCPILNNSVHLFTAWSTGGWSNSKTITPIISISGYM